MSKHIPRILVVGAITVDDSRYVPGGIKSDGKVTAATSEIRLGGGAGNCVQALHKLDEAFGTHSYIKLITRLGRPPADNLRAKLAHFAATEILGQTEIDYVDATRGESVIAFNSVAEHLKGRSIIKDHVTNPNDLAFGIEDTIDNEVRGADVVFVDPSKPRIGVMACRSGNKHNKPVVIDWGQSKWPKDPAVSDMVDEMISRADIVMVPSDAVVRGMNDNEVNPQKLVNTLRNEYMTPHILMSDGGKPVQVYLQDEYHEITVEPWDGDKYALAAGDTRNAGFLYALSRGHDILGAAKIGTAIASIKIRYPGLVWADHVVDDLKENPALTNAANDDDTRSDLDLLCG